MNIALWSEQQLFTFFFIFVRIASIFLFLPIFGDRMVPASVKALLCIALAWICFPVLWMRGLRVAPLAYESNLGIIVSIAQETMMGALIGFVSRWIFDTAQFAGQVAGISMGFSMASVLDPHTESQTVALAELKYILAVMLFLSMNGHHLYLTTITESFRLVPLGAAHWFDRDAQIIKFLITMTSQVLLLSLKLAAPVVVVLLLVNVAFGMASRAVPQMNVFAVSFGANIIVGLFVVLINLPGFTNSVSDFFESYTPELLKFIGLFGT